MALKIVTDRMSQKNQQKDEFYDDNVTITNSDGTARQSKSTYLRKVQDRLKSRMQQKNKD